MTSSSSMRQILTKQQVRQVTHMFTTLQVWRPGIDPIAEDEELNYDPTAYDCLHAFNLEWPCLSFDLLRDDLGGPRSTFPHTLFMVSGTQASSRLGELMTQAVQWWLLAAASARVAAVNCDEGIDKQPVLPPQRQWQQQRLQQ